MFRSGVSGIYNNCINEITNIPYTKIEALRSDRRKDMCGLSHQRDAVLRKSPRCGTRKRINLPARLDGYAPKHGLHALLDPRGKFGIIEGDHFFRLMRLNHPDETGAVAFERHLRERAGLGMEFRRDRSMRSAVCEIQDKRRLRQPRRRNRNACRLARRKNRPSAATASFAISSLPSASRAET